MSVAHSHGSPRTYASPSTSSRRAERTVSTGTIRTPIAATHAALTANVPASPMNAAPAPTAATTRPPRAGPASRVAARPRRRVAHERVERVGLDEVIARDGLGDDRAERRPEERLAGAHERHERDEVPDLQRAGQRQHADGRHDRGAHEVGGDEDAPAVDAVGDDAARQEERD